MLHRGMPYSLLIRTSMADYIFNRGVVKALSKATVGHDSLGDTSRPRHGSNGSSKSSKSPKLR